MTDLAIITGASQGIGRATAIYFADRGWQVINVSRHPCDDERVIQLIADFTDVNWRQQIQTKLHELTHDAKRIALVHNAAMLLKDSIDTVDATNLHQVLQVNVVAATQLNQLVLPMMQAGSSIIYIGSTLSEKAVANTASYTISKHAVAGLMKATCQDLFGKQIHTCCICPGFTDTAMLRAHMQNDAEILAALGERMSYQRLVTPEEIAETIYFSATHAVINGAILHTNLGQLEQ